ncbi:MAG: hypothetical protein ACOZF0_05625 [Thermodesulfobacteriota bacterium]
MQPYSIKRNSLWIALLCVSVFMINIGSFLPVRYESNDDFAIVLELNGFLPGKDCFFLNPVTSHMLHRLYRAVPGLPWYGFYLYSGILLSYTLILGVFLRSNDRFAFLSATPFIFIVFFHCFVFASFTSASLLLLFAVFLCLLEWALTENCPIHEERTYLFLLTLALVMSFSLRWNLVQFASILVFSVVIVGRLSFFRKTLPVWAGFFFLLLLSFWLLFHQYSKDNRFFFQYSNIRGIFHDTDRGEYYGDLTLRAISKAGWDMEDFILFRNYWFLHDINRSNTSSISLFTKENNPTGQIPFFRQVAQRMSLHFQGSKTVTLILFCTLSAVFIRNLASLRRQTITKPFRQGLAIGIVVAGALFLMYYRFVPRVYMPLYCYVAGTFFVILDRLEKPDPVGGSKRNPTEIFLVVALALTLTAAGLTWSKTASLLQHVFARRAEKEQIDRKLSMVAMNRPHLDTVLLIPLDPNSNLLQEAVHPLKEVADFTSIPVLPAGWLIHSKGYLRILRHHGLQNGNELLRWSIDNPAAIWFEYIEKTSKTPVTRLVESYFNKHISPGRKMSMQPVFDFRNQHGLGLVCYRLFEVMPHLSGSP